MSTTTAEGTLTQQRRDGSVGAGGDLVAKALNAEGVDTNFALCGGHDTTRRD
jgi:acetolactate synthase-1/2/3 large subunit